MSEHKFEPFSFEQQPLGVYNNVQIVIREEIKEIPLKIETVTKYRDIVKEVEVVKVKDEQEIQKNYECPVCLENAINVIFQCENGVCAYCKSKTRTAKCFYCRQVITN